MEKVRFFNQPYLLYYGDLRRVLYKSYDYNIVKINVGWFLKSDPIGMAIPHSVFLCSTVIRKPEVHVS